MVIPVSLRPACSVQCTTGYQRLHKIKIKFDGYSIKLDINGIPHAIIST